MTWKVVCGVTELVGVKVGVTGGRWMLKVCDVASSGVKCCHNG